MKFSSVLKDSIIAPARFHSLSRVVADPARGREMAAMPRRDDSVISREPAAATKPVVSSPTLQLSGGEYRLKSESRGRLVPVEKQSTEEARQEESTGQLRSDSDFSSRDSAPVVVDSSSLRKRRASDSFDLQDSAKLVDDDTELVRVNSRVASKQYRVEEIPPKTSNQSSSSSSSLQAPLEKPELSLRVDEVDDDDDSDEPLVRLENVTAQSRSLIPQDLFNPPRPKRTNPLSLKKNKMATAVTTSSNNAQKSSRLRRKFSGLGGSNSKKNSKRENRDEDSDEDAPPPPPRPTQKRTSTKPDKEESRGRRSARPPSPKEHGAMTSAENKSLNHVPPIMTVGSEETPIKSNRTGRSQSPPSESHGRGRPGIVERIRSASRSRSRSRKNLGESHDDSKSILIAVTSCKSDAYHNQKAPGSTSKLPRKAPSNLKLFHELAVGVKDAYAAAGETPTRPDPEEWSKYMSKKEIAGRTVLWEFLGNLDFVSIFAVCC